MNNITLSTKNICFRWLYIYTSGGGSRGWKTRETSILLVISACYASVHGVTALTRKPKSHYLEMQVSNFTHK